MRALAKANAWASKLGNLTGPQQAALARYAFGPPIGGAGYFGTQGYRYQQVLEGYRNWSFVAIGAWMGAIAGGEHPQIGVVTPKTLAGGHKAKKKYVTKAMIGGPSENQEFTELDQDDPMVRLFLKPNEFDVAYDFWAYVVLFWRLTGYCVIWVIRDEYGIPREMWPVPTHWIQLLRTDHNRQPEAYQVQSPWGQRWDIPHKDTVQLTMHSPLNRYEGYAVNIAIAEWLDTYESLIRVRLSQFKNGAVPNIHVALGESYADPDDAWLARFYAKWFSRFQGENQAGLPLITGPDIEVKPIGALPYELFDQEEESIRTEVLAAHNVPQALVTGDPTVDTSAYAPLRTFYRHSVNRALKYFGEKFTEDVIKPTPGYDDCVMRWPDQAPDDPQQKLNEHTARFDRCAESPNEFRAAYGLEPFEHGGDDPFMNGGQVPMASGRKPAPDEELDNAIRQQVSEDQPGGTPHAGDPSAAADGSESEPPVSGDSGGDDKDLGSSSGSAGGFLANGQNRLRTYKRLASRNGHHTALLDFDTFEG